MHGRKVSRRWITNDGYIEITNDTNDTNDTFERITRMPWCKFVSFVYS